MKILTKLQSAFKAAYRSLASYPDDHDYWYTQHPFGAQTLSSLDITQDTALAMSSVYRAMRILSDSVASLPCYLYQRLEDGGRRRAVERVPNRLINVAPNSEMSPFKWKQVAMAHILGWGNHYSYVSRNARGVRSSLIPLSPGSMQVRRNEHTKELEYVYQLQKSEPIVFSPDEILHIGNWSYSGLIGKSVITLARESIGLGISQESWLSHYYGQGTLAGRIVTHPGSPKAEVVKNLKDAIAEQVQGLAKSHRLLFLQDGMKLENVTINPVDSDFIASRKFQTQDIARWFGLPGHMLSDPDSSKGKANMEQESLDFLKFSLMPWLKLLENEFNRYFLTADERQNYYFEFLVDTFLRADIKSRFAAYKVAREMGIMDADEIRAKENLPPLRDGLGKLILCQPGVIPLDVIASGGGKKDED